MPAGVAYAVGALCEAAYTLVGARAEPRVTRFVAKQLSTPHWFDISAARRDLGYDPRVTLDEELERIGTWVRTLRI